jgi:low affinity Fe/Cu permease
MARYPGDTRVMGLSRDIAARDRRLGSGLLHGIDRAVSRPLFALVVVAADVVWVGFSAAFGFPARVDSVFQTLVAALTLAMVFVIQHTQSREELVTQRKLDEILHALPRADDAVIALEEASDDEVSATHQSHRQRRQKAVEPETSSDAGSSP